MATKNKETTTNKEMTEAINAAKEAISKLQGSVSKLKDDVYSVQSEMQHFSEKVSSDITRLVELRNRSKKINLGINMLLLNHLKTLI